MIQKKKIYAIEQWTEWNRTIADAASDFFASFGYQPNILEANKHTHSQFDFLVNLTPGELTNVYKTNEQTGATIQATGDEYVKLGGFECDFADVDFAIDQSLADKQFRLVYDDEPDWDSPKTLTNIPDEEHDFERELGKLLRI